MNNDKRTGRVWALWIPVGMALMGALPSAQVSADEARAAHIARRMFNGGTFSELEDLADPTMIDTVIDEQLPPLGPDGLSIEVQAMLDALEPDLPAGEDWTLDDLVYKQVLLSTYSENQLREVMTKFWEEHFNTYFDKIDLIYIFWLEFVTIDLFEINPPFAQDPANWPEAPYEDDPATLMALENTAFRENALGQFKDLLYASAKSPVMLLYLDGAANIYQGNGTENENYARELLELHTLGKNQKTGKANYYKQEDVVEVARMATGYSFVPDHDKKLDFWFRTEHHDPLPKETILAGIPSKPEGLTVTATGEGELEEVLDFLAGAPETARFVSRKLIANFVDETVIDETAPQDLQDLLEDCVDVWGPTGDISAVLDVIFSSAAFRDNVAYRRNKVSQPYEYMISLFRRYASGEVSDPSDFDEYIRILEYDCRSKLFRVPAPDGESRKSLDWCTTGQMMHRARMAWLLFTGVVSGDPELNYADAVPYDVIQLLQDLGASLGDQRDVVQKLGDYEFHGYANANDFRQINGFLGKALDGSAGTPLATLLAQGTPAALEEYTKRVAQTVAMTLGRTQASTK